MAKMIKAQGSYSVKATGEEVTYDFEYPTYENLDSAIEENGEEEVLGDYLRMVKIDANNTAREKAKVANGHSTRQPLSEEEKAQRKAQRQADRDLLSLIKSKGLTLADLKKI